MPADPLVAFASANGMAERRAGSPGGCTRDLVHRFYQEQYQLDGGDAGPLHDAAATRSGSTMGDYDTKALPIYQYLHAKGAPATTRSTTTSSRRAFGGSFLNHQWLIAAATPVDPTALPAAPTTTSTPVLDANGMPIDVPALHVDAGTAVQRPAADRDVRCRSRRCRPPIAASVACGNWAVNTMQPRVPAVSRARSARDLPLQTAPTIGDRLTAAGVDWAWYSGGWANANGDVGEPGLHERRGHPQRRRAAAPTRTSTRASEPACLSRTGRGARTTCSSTTTSRSTTSPTTPRARPDGRTSRTRSTSSSLAQSSDKKDCNLKHVSFIKPIGEENEHPGYASEPNGNDHLVDLLQIDRGQRVREGHDGRRHVRRVRRPVGSRVAARPGQRQRPARRLGPGHADPGARSSRRTSRATSSSTRPSTTRRRSSRRSSTATGSRRSARATRR